MNVSDPGGSTGSLGSSAPTYSFALIGEERITRAGVTQGRDVPLWDTMGASGLVRCSGMGQDREKIRLATVGLKLAQGRYMEARTGQDSDPPFIALSEGLWWCVILQDLVDATTPLLQGLRYARNGVGHDDNMTTLLKNTKGASYPIQYPKVWHEWKWRTLDELPYDSKVDRKGESAYQGELADKPARLTFEEVISYFDGVLDH